MNRHAIDRFGRVRSYVRLVRARHETVSVRSEDELRRAAARRAGDTRRPAAGAGDRRQQVRSAGAVGWTSRLDSPPRRPGRGHAYAGPPSSHRMRSVPRYTCVFVPMVSNATGTTTGTPRARSSTPRPGPGPRTV